MEGGEKEILRELIKLLQLGIESDEIKDLDLLFS